MILGLQLEFAMAQTVNMASQPWPLPGQVHNPPDIAGVPYDQGL